LAALAARRRRAALMPEPAAAYASFPSGALVGAASLPRSALAGALEVFAAGMPLPQCLVLRGSGILAAIGACRGSGNRRGRDAAPTVPCPLWERHPCRDRPLSGLWKSSRQGCRSHSALSSVGAASLPRSALARALEVVAAGMPLPQCIVLCGSGILAAIGACRGSGSLRGRDAAPTGAPTHAYLLP
jgi:hypothetical protein